jgi:hypothetical protein
VRVEKVAVPAEQLRPCQRSGPGMPDPDTAALSDVTGFLPVLVGRLEACADQVDAVRTTLGASAPPAP